jgi:hypothetical protein
MSFGCFPFVCVLLLAPFAPANPPEKAPLDAHGFPLPEGAIARLGDLRCVHPGG